MASFFSFFDFALISSDDILSFFLAHIRRRRIIFVLVYLWFWIICPFVSFALQLSFYEHCSLIHETIHDGQELYNISFLDFRSGYFNGGELILPESAGAPLNLPKSVHLLTTRVTGTDKDGILKVYCNLYFRSGHRIYGATQVSTGAEHLNHLRSRSPRVFNQRAKTTFSMHGYWSESTGRLCLVGTGTGFSREGKFLDLSAGVVLTYPINSSVMTDFINGTVESLERAGSANYFDKITILGFPEGNSYQYTLVAEAEKACSFTHVKEKTIDVGTGGNICSVIRRFSSGFRLDYPANCSSPNCGLFNDASPTFMLVDVMHCLDGGKLHLKLGFYGSAYSLSMRDLSSFTWISEGVWDGANSQLCLVACRLPNLANLSAPMSVEDCSFRVTLWFPSVLSLRERSAVNGRIWSVRNTSDLGYFERISFRSLDPPSEGTSGLSYQYTHFPQTKQSCGRIHTRKVGGRRDSGKNSLMGLRLGISGKNAEGQTCWGYLKPLTMEDRFYNKSFAGEVHRNLLDVEQNLDTFSSKQGILNVSYTVILTLPRYFKWGKISLTEMQFGMFKQVVISAEGIYDNETGDLCMIGCRDLHVGSHNASLDCEIIISLHFIPQYHKSGEHLIGTIRSIRQKFDPVYFEALDLYYFVTSKVNMSDAVDVEITMVLLSLTLACILISLQLLYVRKNTEVRVYMSLMMLSILTLGYMSPLVLNFEAFMKNHSQQDALMWHSGWLELNEVVVRIMTMVAFLLHFRVLQMTWSARLAEGNKENFGTAEKKVAYMCLCFYLMGGLIAVVTYTKTAHVSASKLGILAKGQHSVWGSLRSYCGLILDAFLLPQILLNLFLNSNKKALVPSFYHGTTILRSMPHAYYAYRAHKYSFHWPVPLKYAGRRGNLYSTTWDIVLPFGGMLLSLVLYLQQRYGGACILPLKLRGYLEYERVPIVGN